ncbi:MAG: AMP-binding protein [Actinomycetota bacterium]
MPELIAADLPAGPTFVDVLRSAWDAGDAVLPVDQRLPPAAKAELISAAGASVVIDDAGASPRAGGWPTEPGDAVVVATSGTTGVPKFAVLDHDAIVASARITSSAIGADPSRDGWLCCLPVAHIGGLSVVTRALHTGTPLTVLERFEPDRVIAAARRGATLVSLVVAALARVDPAEFRVILLGGSAIPADRPANSVATYGMTETGSGVVYEGRALEGVELRVDDGEVVVRSPTLLRCYRDGSDPKDGDGWYRTGDAGALSEDGTLTVSGRIGDVIVTGGEKVWPVMVERAIDETGAVDLPSVVIGRPDPEWGHVVTLVCETSGPPPALEEIRDRLRDALPGYALPRRIEVVASFPRTGIGKVRKSLL